MSEVNNKLKLYQKLAMVRDEMPVFVKDETGHGYKYVTLDAIQRQLHPVLKKHKLHYFHLPVAESSKSGIIIKIVDLETGEAIEHTFTMELGGKVLKYIDKKARDVVEYTGDEFDPQAHGGVHTYFRRYSLVAMFDLILEGEDDDGASVAKGNRSYGKASRLKPEEYIYIDDYENKDRWKATPGAYYHVETKRWAVVKSDETVRALYKEIKPKAYDHNGELLQ
jgi:hypothetical protein